MKLHLGCGKRHIPGYIHIDAVDYPHIDHVATIDNLSFVVDNSVDVIYTCHVLEHFKRRDALPQRFAQALDEAAKLLEPKSVRSLCVPIAALILK